MIKEATGGFNEETVRKALKLLKRVKLLAVTKEKDLGNRRVVVLGGGRCN